MSQSAAISACGQSRNPGRCTWLLIPPRPITPTPTLDSRIPCSFRSYVHCWLENFVEIRSLLFLAGADVKRRYLLP